jgi:hypothetical protein
VWDPQEDAIPTTNLDSTAITCATHARQIADDGKETPVLDDAPDGSAEQITTPCHMDPAVAAKLNTQVGSNIGTQLAKVCPLFQQEENCEMYGCTWTSSQTWKCTSAGNAELEPICNAIKQYKQCQMTRGMCEPVDLDATDEKIERCAADCDWEAEASKYYSAGIAIGRYEVENHVRLGVDNVANLMGYTEAFTQKPTAACPHVCDGLLLKMWLEEGMVYENKGNRVMAGLGGEA